VAVIVVSCSAKDILGSMPVEDVWRWYHRLAAHIGKTRIGGREPMASQFLARYVSPQSRVGPETFTAPPYLLGHSILTSALEHHRRVYLTQEEMRTGGGGRRWAGIKPRWNDPVRYGWNRTDPLPMYYKALVQVPLRWQLTGNTGEKDILHSLGLGFQLRTDVVCRVIATGGKLDVTFTSFAARIEDTYDFDYNEHLNLPNPDNRSSATYAVCTSKDSIVVYHKNAKRMEQSLLAAPYDLQSQAWAVTTPSISGPGTVNP